MYIYKDKEQTFYDIADDVVPRYTTAACRLDAYTMVGADKFENIFISRVPKSKTFVIQTLKKISKTIQTTTNSNGNTGIWMELLSKWNNFVISMSERLSLILKSLWCQVPRNRWSFILQSMEESMLYVLLKADKMSISSANLKKRWAKC